MDDSDARRTLAPSERSRLRRHAERGHYDEATIHPILDEALGGRDPAPPRRGGAARGPRGARLVRPPAAVAGDTRRR